MGRSCDITSCPYSPHVVHWEKSQSTNVGYFFLTFNRNLPAGKKLWYFNDCKKFYLSFGQDSFLENPGWLRFYKKTSFAFKSLLNLSVRNYLYTTNDNITVMLYMLPYISYHCHKTAINKSTKKLQFPSLTYCSTSLYHTFYKTIYKWIEFIRIPTTSTVCKFFTTISVFIEVIFWNRCTTTSSYFRL